MNTGLDYYFDRTGIAIKSDPAKLCRMPKILELDESDNVRTGKYTRDEAEAIFASLPKYMTDVAAFAHEAGSRKSEILKLEWPWVSGDLITVPRTKTKARKVRIIAITPKLEEILRRRRLERKPGCDLIFHNDGAPIRDFRKCWQTACVINGLGVFFCRDCRDESGQYASILDAKRVCPRCAKYCLRPKYSGRLFHDFRRTAAHEAWKSGSTIEDCMELTGHTTPAMFKRYADLFSDEEKRQRQLEVQKRRHEHLEAKQTERATSQGTGKTRMQ